MMPSQHLCLQYLLQSPMLFQGSFSYFDPEYKASFVLKIKGEGQGRVEGLRNKVQFHDMLCNCLYVCYVHNDQNQFLLPRNGPSNLILD